MNASNPLPQHWYVFFGIIEPVSVLSGAVYAIGEHFSKSAHVTPWSLFILQLSSFSFVFELLWFPLLSVPGEVPYRARTNRLRPFGSELDSRTTLASDFDGFGTAR